MFVARHETVSHRVALPLAATEALELFTPEGERLWIDEWNPRYMFPANGEAIEGMVFITGEGAETTYWTMAEFDIVKNRVRYMRVTPASRSSVIEVRCIPGGERQCQVEVTYVLTGLTEDGNTAIEAFIGDAFTAMIERWREKILTHLERSPHRVFGDEI